MALGPQVGPGAGRVFQTIPMLHLRSLTPLLATALLAAGGCGGGSEASEESVVAQPASTTAREDLSPATLSRELGNSFSQGLYRLAVMSQRGDEATDLGQDLPTGIVVSVRCSGGDRCEVHWRPRDAPPTTTAYDVDYPLPGCFEALADPPLPQRHDATIDTFSENPLNSLVSARPECS